MSAMESVASHLDESTGYFVNHWQLLERIEKSDRNLEQRIAAAAAAEKAASAAPARRRRGGGRRLRNRSTSIRRSPRSSPTRRPS